MAVEDTVSLTFKAIDPGDPEVKSVKVSGPTEANVGEPVSFSAVVYDQYDEPMPTRGVDWIVLPDGYAEVMDFDPQSMILKGVQPGSITITGRVKEVTPGPDPDPNEWPPEGYANLYPPVDFTNGWPEGWQVRESAQGGLALLTLEDGNPVTGGWLARHTYLPGNSDGAGACFLISPRGPDGVKDMIVEEVFRISENFQGHQSGVNKNGYTIDDDRDGVDPAYGTKHPHIFNTDGGGSGPLKPGIGGQDQVDNRVRGDFELVRGNWYRVRYRILMSSDPNVGGYWIWAAPLGEPLQLVGQWTLATTGPDRDGFLDRYQLRPIWGGRGDSVVETMWKDWAQIRIAGR